MKKYAKKYFWDIILCILISAGLSANVSVGFAQVSPLETCFILLVILLVVFGAGRSRAGLIVLFLLGTLMTSAFAFLEYPVSLWGCAVFLFSVFALYLYRVYCISLLQSEKGQIDYRAYFIQATAAALAVMLLAGGICYGVVRSLPTPADESKLTKILMSSELLQKLGVSYETKVSHDKLPADKSTESIKNKQKNEVAPDQKKAQQDQKKNGKIVQSNDSLSALAITFHRNAGKLRIAAVAVLFLLIVAVILKRFLRKKWYAGVLAETKEDGVMKFYNYYTKKLRKTGFKRPESQTLSDYALSSQQEMELFSVGDADFRRLTQIYLSILYGYRMISDEEQELFLDFHKEFYRNLRKKMGLFKYCMKYFSI